MAVYDRSQCDFHLPSDCIEIEPTQSFRLESRDRVGGATIYAGSECHQANTVIGPFLNELFEDRLRMSARFDPLAIHTTKSSEDMLKERSMATAMSMPLAFTCVWLLVKRGWARATVNNGSQPAQRRGNPPARRRETFNTARTNCTDE